MGLRVVQWATGGVGVAAIKGVIEHPDLELAGCWVHSADKAGKDVGDIIGDVLSPPNLYPPFIAPSLPEAYFTLPLITRITFTRSKE